MILIYLTIIVCAVLAPKLTTFAFVVPVLGFTFGGFAWAIGGVVGWSTLSWSSFLTHVGLACLGTLFLVMRESKA